MEKSPILQITCVLALGFSVASAATVSTAITPIVLTESSNTVDFNLNSTLGLVTDSIPDFQLLVRDFGPVATFSVAPVGSNTVGVTDTGAAFAARLQAGDTVGPTLDFGGSTILPPSLALETLTTSDGEWAGGGVGYIPLQFQIDGADHFGFARVTWTPDLVGTESTGVIDLVGFNTVAGEAATVVPEPSALLLSALGLLACFKRRR